MRFLLCLLAVMCVAGLEMTVRSGGGDKLTYLKYLQKVKGFFNTTGEVLPSNF